MRRLKKIVLLLIKKPSIVIVLGIAYLVLRGGLNYSGFCWAEKRWLSDEDRINKEIEHIVGRTKEHIESGVHGSGYYDVIPYTSIEEFKDKNPNCCKVRTYSFYLSDSFNRLFGRSNKLISVNYIISYIHENQVYEIEKKRTMSSDFFEKYQTNCGDYYHPLEGEYPSILIRL